MAYRLILFFLLFSYFSYGQNPLNVYRSAPSVTANDAYFHAYKGLGVPVVTDTAHGLNGSLDSLGLIIQVRATGKQYKRDTVSTGGHQWTEIGSGAIDTASLSARINLKKDKADSVASGGFTTIANKNKLADSLGAIMATKVANFLGVQTLGYGPYASKPTSGTGIYYASDSTSFFYINGAAATNLTVSFNLYMRGKGQPGDTTLVTASGNSLYVAAIRDSASGCVKHVINSDGSWTFYSTCMVNYGNAPGQLQGTYAGLPAATSYPTGTTYIAQDNGIQLVDTGSGPSRGWKQIAGAGGGTVTTDTTLTGNGSGGSPLGMNQNLVASASYFNKGYPATNTSLFWGNSITFGFGAANPWPYFVQNSLTNTTVNNGAVSSTAVRTSYAYQVNNMPQFYEAPTLGEAAFNNIRIPMAGDTAHRFGIVKAGYRAMAALQFANQANMQFFYMGTGTQNANMTSSVACGSCIAASPDTLLDYSSRTTYYRANVTGQSGANWFLRSSITANETVTITGVKGAGFVVGTWADSLGWSRIQVMVDGNVVTTYDPNNRIDNQNYDAGFHRYGIQNDAIIVTGLRDSSHTVILTFLDGGTRGGFDYICGLKSPTACYNSPFYLLDIPHMNATGYSSPTTSAAVQDSCNSSRLIDLTNNFPGYPFVRVNMNYPVGHYNPADPTMIQADGIHPTQIGQRAIATDVLAAMNPKQSINGLSDVLARNNSSYAGQQLKMAGFNSYAPSIFAGPELSLQNISTNFSEINFNVQWDGANNRYVNTGPANQLTAFNGTLIFRNYSSGTAGASGNANLTSPVIFGSNGVAAFGTNVVSTSPYTGANTLIFPSGSIGLGSTTEDTKALINMVSTTRGIRFPVMTTTQKNAIPSPGAGLMVYDQTLDKPYFFTNASSLWTTFLQDRLDADTYMNLNTRKLIFTKGFIQLDSIGPDNTPPYILVQSADSLIRHITPANLATLLGTGSSAPFSDATALVKNSSDATKLAKFDASGITTGTTRTYSLPDFNGIFAMTNHAQTWTGAQDFTSATTNFNVVTANQVSATQLASTGTAPNVTIGSAAPSGGGTTATASSGSNGMAGEVVITTGTGSGSGVTVVTIASTSGANPNNYRIFLQDTYTAAHVNVRVNRITSTTWSIELQTGQTLAASTTYSWNYFISN